MGNLTLAAFLLAVMACSGNGGGSGGGDDDDTPPARCGDGIVDANEQCDDGNSIAGDGCTLCMIDTQRSAKLNATWELVTAANDDTMAACPAGFDTAVLTSTPAAGGLPTVDLFDCSAKLGTSSSLMAAAYTATIAITNHDRTSTFATSLPETIDLSDATDKPIDAQFITDGGVFHVQWKLVKASDGSAVDCDAVSAMAHVKVSGTPVGTSNATVSSALCSDGSFTTAPFPAATYTITVSVQNDVFSTKGSAPDIANVVMTAPNGLVDLGTVTIPVSNL